MSRENQIRRLGRRTLAIVLAGGRGSRLKNLTDRRAKPAVPFGGKYRIIDFALSNCMNSNIRRIYVMTQYKSHSLLRHLQRGWGYLRAEMGEFVDLLPAQQRVDEALWYRGTADAVWQNLDILARENADLAIILAGDHIYRQDYSVMIERHVALGADCTVGCVPVPRAEASAFGVMAVDAEGRIVGFLEKPADPPAMPHDQDKSLASMGIYVFNTEFLYRALIEDAGAADTTHDFGKDIIPRMVADPNIDVRAHSLADSAIFADGQTAPYWRDVGTIDAYWEANLDLAAVTPELDLYDAAWPVYTYQEQLPAAKFVFDEPGRRGLAIDSVASAGCIISGGEVRNSILFNRVRVNSHARIDQCVVLPRCNIGRDVRLSKVIVDSGCDLPRGLVAGEDPVDDARRFDVSEGGVTVITRDMLRDL